MERKINVIIKFNKYDININTIESDGIRKTVIFNHSNKSTDIFSATSFIKSTINMINTEIGGKINSAIVLVENNSKLNEKLHSVTKELNLINGIVNQKDLDNAMKLIKKDFIDNIDQSLIHVQPVQYIVHSLEKKRYKNFPLGKKGTTLIIQAVVTTISTKVLNSVCGIMENSNVKIDYITTSAHAIPHETLSKSSLESGGASIHIDKRETYVTLNFNNSTFKYKLISKGYKDILKKIKLTFNCSYEEANDLFYAYGNLDNSVIKIDKAIYMIHSGICNNVFRISDLSNLIKVRIKEILLEAKSFIDSQTTNKMSITISGVCNTLNSLCEFSKLTLNSMDVNIYKPLSYICKKNINVEYIGVLKYIDTYNKNIGKDFTSIIHTNPNTMRFLPQSEKKSIFKKLLSRMTQRGNYAQRQ